MALIGGLSSRWPLTRVLSLFMLITAGLLVLFVGSGFGHGRVGAWVADRAVFQTAALPGSCIVASSV